MDRYIQGLSSHPSLHLFPHTDTLHNKAVVHVYRGEANLKKHLSALEANVDLRAASGWLRN
ncbi:hypothetical protein E2C01_032741 [Portunus trituberculatus]|uniref:Uncharacterized protein n=1 Tax=Portunus trituberculatus TaxID=210409 RepID=A0A5B7F3Q0_PORTR|nr:hypothetical protein [Portunus trituberculatus]